MSTNQKTRCSERYGKSLHSLLGTLETINDTFPTKKNQPNINFTPVRINFQLTGSSLNNKRKR